MTSLFILEKLVYFANYRYHEGCKGLGCWRGKVSISHGKCAGSGGDQSSLSQSQPPLDCNHTTPQLKPESIGNEEEGDGEEGNLASSLAPRSPNVRKVASPLGPLRHGGRVAGCMSEADLD
jgi:hypothetical protein